MLLVIILTPFSFICFVIAAEISESKPFNNLSPLTHIVVLTPKPENIEANSTAI